MRIWIRRVNEEVGQRLLEIRAHVLEEEVVAAEDGRWDDNIGVDSPVWEVEFTCQDFAPALRFAAGVFVADKKRGLHLFKELLEGVVGMTAEDEADSPLGCIGFDVAQSLLHEVVVAKVRVGVVGNNGKEDDDRKAEVVGDLDCGIEGGVRVNAHGALHPVDDAFAIGARRAIAADEDARIRGELGERCWCRRHGHASSIFHSPDEPLGQCVVQPTIRL